jgi:PelA/Pel-15E family pectate lyase
VILKTSTIRWSFYIAFLCIYIGPLGLVLKANTVSVKQIPDVTADVNNTNKNASDCLKHALDFYISIMTKRQYEDYGICGGWASGYSSDLKTRMGEWRRIGPDWICIQRPGTPYIGTIMLQGYLVLKDQRYLDAARQTGNLLLAGASQDGGFAFEMWLGPDRPHGVHQTAVNPPDKPSGFMENATMDDHVTQDSVEFLYQLWLVSHEEKYYKGYLHGLDFFLKAQKENGSIPQAYPAGGYSALATFNDDVMLSVFQSLIRSYQRTGNKTYFDAAMRIAQWVKNNRIGDSGWSTQTTDDGKPAGARLFEPPSVGALPTWHAFIILTEAYRWTKDESLLEPMPGAYAWLKKAQLPNGRWARFYYPETTRPRYRTADGRDVNETEARPGYTWQGNWGRLGIDVYDKFMAEKDKLVTPKVPDGGIREDPADLILPKDTGMFRFSIDNIIASQDSRGAFVFRGQINNMVFGSNVAQLIRQIDLTN